MSLTVKIITGMILGFLTGLLINVLSLNSNEMINIYLVNGLFDTIGSIFISSLKLMVVPLVFFSLSTGVASFDKDKKLSVIALKTISLYLLTTAIAISLGLFIAILFSPGEGLNLTSSAEYIAPSPPGIKSVIIDIFPTNPISAMAEGKMLQIIIFSIFFGVALRSIKDKNSELVKIMESTTNVVMKMVFILINLAPFGVYCLMANLFATQGIGIVGNLFQYFLLVVFVLIIHGFVVYPALLYSFTKIKPFGFYKKLRPVMLFAFSTSSSNATMPVTLKTVTQDLGVNPKIASFTIPLGATVNMDGTAIMQGVATIFIANAYNIDLSTIDYLMVILTATMASIGTAGVPGVGLIMLAMVLSQVGLPTEGIALILGVDRLLDMIRTVVNVTGDSTVSTIVAHSEGALDNNKNNN
ncbi:dicarboxylate/amino acid:cation symporter [Hyphomicrobiales bacterium]|jgi:Na+/H+-dicarboxylate symporter|nr:dicarboxylate/amino acid:cation symporter [Hyphomicrobiales bacterium]MDB9926703.1 dicarboxylate/amino acid:cation symporter [Hyphomicrobiales bacterium]|tara:strand:- start:4200 stop:5438 length:1239 start_codon:yes stop_codon:yes gene_type:complete